MANLRAPAGASAKFQRRILGWAALLAGVVPVSLHAADFTVGNIRATFDQRNCEPGFWPSHTVVAIPKPETKD